MIAFFKMDYLRRPPPVAAHRHKVGVRSHDRVAVHLGPVPNRLVGCLLEPDVAYMNQTWKKWVQSRKQTWREILVEKEIHPTLILRPASAANWNTAGKSSFSRSECSSRISASLIPAPSQPRMSHTIMRRPRTHGLPPRLPGSMVILSIPVGIFA